MNTESVIATGPGESAGSEGAKFQTWSVPGYQRELQIGSTAKLKSQVGVGTK